MPGFFQDCEALLKPDRRLVAQLAAVLRQNERLAKANRKLQAAASWRITAPLRYLRAKFG